MIKKNLQPRQFTPIVCYSILFPEIVKQQFPHYQPTLTIEDWESCFPEISLNKWVSEISVQTENVHYSDLDRAISRALSNPATQGT